MLQPYPACRGLSRPTRQAERETGWIQGVVLAVRQIRGEMNISPARRIALLLKGASAQDEGCVRAPSRLARAARGTREHHGFSARTPPTPQAATALVGNLTLLVPMAGLIDVGAEVQRLERLLGKAREGLAKARAKLANENFVRGAPAAVVTTERERAAEFERSASSLAQQLERVRGLPAS